MQQRRQQQQQQQQQQQSTNQPIFTNSSLQKKHQTQGDPHTGSQDRFALRAFQWRSIPFRLHHLRPCKIWLLGVMDIVWVCNKAAYFKSYLLFFLYNHGGL